MLATFGCTGDENTYSVDSPNPNPFQPKGTVSGVLRDAETNVPLVGAVVHLMDKKAVTDESGSFTITNVPALEANGNEPSNKDAAVYTLVIDMKAINAALTKQYDTAKTADASRFYYPEIAYDYALPYYTSLGDTGTTSSVAIPPVTGGTISVQTPLINTTNTNHDTPVDGFVCNIQPFVGKLAAAIKMQVVNSKLQPQANAVVTLYHNSYDFNHADNSASGTAFAPANNIIQTQTADANGFVTFNKIEVKQGFVVKAVTADGSNQGWYYNYAANNGAPTAVAPAAGDVIISPLAGQTDLYAAQGGAVTSPQGTLNAVYSNALVVYSVDGVAPFITSVDGIANLADIAIPTEGNLVVTFNFSEPLNTNSKYAQATTQDTAINGGIWNDVYINYLGPKAGNIDHSIAWASNTALQVTIPVASLTEGSRYTVDITNALNGLGKRLALAAEATPTIFAGVTLVDGTVANPSQRLVDANGNVFRAFGNAKLTFTTSGGISLARPTLVSSTATPYTVDWTPIANAASYNVYVHKVGTPENTFVAGANPLNQTATTFSLTSLPAIDFSNGAAYEVYVVPVNGMGTPGPASNIITISEVVPATPAAPTRRLATARIIDWAPVAGASGYKVYVQTLVNDTALGGFVAVDTTIDPTFDLAAAAAAGTARLNEVSAGYVPAGLPYAGGGVFTALPPAAPENGYVLGSKLSYRVAIAATSPTATVDSPLSAYIVIDDRSATALTGADVVVGAASLAPTPIGGALAAVNAQPGFVGAYWGLTQHDARAFTQAVTLTMPEQLSYTSAIAAANYKLVVLNPTAFGTTKPTVAQAAAVDAAITGGLADVIPTITDIAYVRNAAGGTVTFTLNYPAVGSTNAAWYGSAGSIVLQATPADLNGIAMSLFNNGATNNGGVVIN